MIPFIQKHSIFTLIATTVVLQIVVLLYYQFNGFFGQDSYEYLRITRALNAYYTSGEPIPYTVYPIMYPIFCSLLNVIIPDTFFAMQFVSMASCLLSAVVLVKILQLLEKNTTSVSIFVLIFFILSPYILRFSLIAMSDMFCIAMWLLTLYYSLRFEQSIRIKPLLLAALFGGLTLMTRYPSVVLLLLPAIICLKTIHRSKSYFYIIPVILAAGLSLLPDLLIRGRFIFWNMNDNGPAFSYHFFAEQFNLFNLFKKDFYNIDGWQHYSTPNVIFAFFPFIHPAFIFCGVFFAILLIKNKNHHRYSIFLLVNIMLYTVFIGCNPYQNNRYLMFVLPAVLLLYYIPFRNFITQYHLNSTLIKIAYCAAILVQIFLFTLSFQSIVHYNRLEKEIANYVGNLPDSPVYTISIDGALAAYHPELEIINLYNTALSEQNMQPGHVLYNPSAFSQQFEGLLPEINFQFLQQHFQLQPLKHFDDGWVIYKLY